MKIAMPLFCLIAVFTTACSTSRSAGRYGDGSVYDGIGDVKTLRRFYIRNFDIDEGYKALVSPAKIQPVIPDLVRARGRKTDVPIDVSIRFSSPEQSGDWSFCFAFLGSIIPSWMTIEYTATVEVSFGDDDGTVTRQECRFERNFKTSVFSPLGWIPYSPKEGFQENETSMGVMQDLSSDVVATTVSKCIAMQLKGYVVEKLTIPDVEFDFKEEK